MGGDKSKQQTAQQTQTKTEYVQSPEERERLAFQLEQEKQFAPFQQSLNTNAANLINALLQGQALPGYLNQLPGGIDAGVTQGIVNQSLSDIAPRFQASGILDSGVAAQISGRTAADIRNQSAQFNLQNLQQLLNLAVGGQSQVQQPAQQTSAQIGNSLAGLRSVNQSGTTQGTTTNIGMNPFWKSFQTSAGQRLGNPSFSAGPFTFGGS